MGYTNFKISWRIEHDERDQPLAMESTCWLPHFALKKSAERQLEAARAESDLRLQRLDCGVVVLLSALYVESVLNFLVREHMPNWEGIVRSKRWFQKADLLVEMFPGKLDPSRRPWQDVMKAFTVRNDIAHAKFAVTFKSPGEDSESPVYCPHDGSKTLAFRRNL